MAVKDSGGTTLKTYGYDGLHRRISETASDTTTDFYYSDAWQVLEERVTSHGRQSVSAQYVWSPVYVDALVLRDRDTNGDGTLDERLWVVQDANYNVTALFDNSGSVVERYAYDPFGNVTVLDADFNLKSGGSEHGWLYLHQGGRYDAASGLYHFRFRDYSPTLGRWTSLDPIRYAAGDVNLYRYVGNTPTIYVDPSGQEGDLPLPDHVAVPLPNSRLPVLPGIVPPPPPWWDYSILGHPRTGWFARFSNGAAGYADALSFGGLTSYARRGIGYDDVVDYGSGAYFWGQVGGTVHAFVLGYQAARAPQGGVWAYRAAQGYTAAGTVYGVGHSSYVLVTDPQHFGLTDALGFVPLGGYLTGKGIAAGRALLRPRPGVAAPTSSGTVPTRTNPTWTLNERVLRQLEDPRLGSLQGKLTADRLSELANSPSARRFWDARSNNINIIQEVEGKLLRITVARDKFEIISVGPIRERNIISSVARGDFIELK